MPKFLELNLGEFIGALTKAGQHEETVRKNFVDVAVRAVHARFGKDLQIEGQLPSETNKIQLYVGLNVVDKVSDSRTQVALSALSV